jgi:hypothetical protein
LSAIQRQAPLVFDALKNQTAAGQKFPSRGWIFSLSDIALRRADGIWIGQKTGLRSSARATAKPISRLKTFPPEITTACGFTSALNRPSTTATPRNGPPEHPLNPDVNHLYWGWSREYVFLALEGGWQNGGKQSGFSYHLATDRQLMTVELPVALD